MSYTKMWERQTKLNLIEDVFDLLIWKKIDYHYREVIQVLLLQARDSFRELIGEWDKERDQNGSKTDRCKT